jgi:nifR3 family TIM-barrel protein
MPKRPASFHIGEIAMDGDLVLAPMEGFSDIPFRSLCREFGSALSYTDFINAQELLSGNRLALQKLDFRARERPVGIQIYDSELENLLAAARIIRDKQPDFIDINMGCSVRSISGRGAGAGLLRSPLKVARIFETLTSELNIPITGKIRLGWDEEHLNYLDIAAAIQENSGALIAVHARTRSQKYSGQANWDAIAEIKSMASIPVLGNGDVRSISDIERMLSHTGCDGVMIGRAAMGNPWIFQRRSRSCVPVGEVFHVITRHLKEMCSFYGEERGVLLFRKHLVRYLAPYPAPDDLRQNLLTTPEVSLLLNKLSRALLELKYISDTQFLSATEEDALESA